MPRHVTSENWTDKEENLSPAIEVDAVLGTDDWIVWAVAAEHAENGVTQKPVLVLLNENGAVARSPGSVQPWNNVQSLSTGGTHERSIGIMSIRNRLGQIHHEIGIYEDGAAEWRDAPHWDGHDVRDVAFYDGRFHVLTHEALVRPVLWTEDGDSWSRLEIPDASLLFSTHRLMASAEALAIVGMPAKGGFLGSWIRTSATGDLVYHDVARLPEPYSPEIASAHGTSDNLHIMWELSRTGEGTWGMLSVWDGQEWGTRTLLGDETTTLSYSVSGDYGDAVLVFGGTAGTEYEAWRLDSEGTIICRVDLGNWGESRMTQAADGTYLIVQHDRSSWDGIHLQFVDEASPLCVP